MKGYAAIEGEGVILMAEYLMRTLKARAQALGDESILNSDQVASLETILQEATEQMNKDNVNEAVSFPIPLIPQPPFLTAFLWSPMFGWRSSICKAGRLMC